MLAALVAAAIAVPGCRTGLKSYASAAPPFVVSYPASWHQTSAAGVAGPAVIFSPEATVGPDSPRITLEVMPMKPRRQPEGGAEYPNVVIEQPLDNLGEDLSGHRWLVTMYPSAVVIEAYAPPRRFAKIKAVAGRMADDIRQTVQDRTSR